jgi:glycerol-3-phosphate dehydrogenase
MDFGGYTIFPLPSKESKGVLVSPTTSGNVIVGPTSIISESDSTITTKDALDLIAKLSNSMLKNVNLTKNIRVFSGIRTLVGDDFIIEKDNLNNDIINITGICSPGLTASPAIAEEVLKLLNFDNDEIEIKHREKYIKTSTMTVDQLNELIKKDHRYGKIICRCENISEGEIIDALNSPLKPTSIDGIKRRVRAGMGRCQGGFCALKIMELISKHRNIPFDKVCKENLGSEIVVGDIR